MDAGEAAPGRAVKASCKHDAVPFCSERPSRCGGTTRPPPSLCLRRNLSTAAQERFYFEGHLRNFSRRDLIERGTSTGAIGEDNQKHPRIEKKKETVINKRENFADVLSAPL